MTNKINKEGNIRLIQAFIISLLVMLFTNISLISVFAGDLDEIVRYDISASVNDDATVTLRYHVEWKVLDSDSEGPLTWVTIGIPNKHYSQLEALSETIKSISYDSGNGSNVRIDLDRAYYEGEVVSFDFSLVQDYIYSVNKFEEGYTVYSFTPGWFDEIDVDNMTIRWEDASKAESWTPDCFMEGNSLVWEQSPLSEGEKYTVTVTYPNDAYGFDLSKNIEESVEDEDDWIYALLFLVLLFGWIVVGFIRIVSGIVYAAGAEFGTGPHGKKITRTKIVYYDKCPSCGAVRGDGQTKCEYCGNSFIKSKETITEKDIRGKEKEAAGFNKRGEFRYTDDPNTFIRVNVISAPKPRRSYRSGSHHSSCAHSSCACACACACAGGGRAGCSTKDFYKTNLKFRMLKNM